MRNPNGSSRDAPVSVTFPIPRRAASKLRTLAVSRDRRLLDLGVLAVQINEGESIVLGIKLGKQRIKKTEVSSEKVRGNARRGRVKKPLSCRNVATIHHMPNSSSSKLAHNLKSTQTEKFSSESGEEERKDVSQLDRELLGCNLFNYSSKTVGKPSNNSSEFRVSNFTTSLASGVALNGESCPAKLSAHQTDKPQNCNDFTRDESNVSQGSTGQHTTQISSTSPAMITSRTASDESYLSSAQTLSSPSSQRAYSSSPSSDSSSTSLEEHFDIQHDQLIYSCFVDRSRYSAADMLKKLAKGHAGKKVTNDSPMGNTVPLTVDTSSSVSSNSNPSGNALSHSSGVLGDKRRSKIPGSYREHVKNIRCSSLTSVMTSTSTVNSTLKLPSADVDQTLGRGTEEPSDFGVGIHSGLTQHFSHHTALSKPSTASQTKSLKTNTIKTPTYHGGRKVLWSSSNAFPRSAISSPHFPVNKPNDSFPKLDSSSSRNVALLSQVGETTAISSHVKNTETTHSDTVKLTASATRSDTIKPTASATRSDTVKPTASATRSDTVKPTASATPSDTIKPTASATPCRGQEFSKEITTAPDSSKTVSVRAPSLVLNSHVSVSMQNTSPCTIASASSTCIPEVTSNDSSSKVVQDLAMVRPTVPAPVVVAGTNTQTTWSNQQVSPTYFVGAQGQYGIYSALYSPDVSNKQLGQQALAAAYPLNYVYPISFVYPYLAMAQANSMKSVQSEKGEQQKRDTEVTQPTTSAETSKIAKVEPSVDAKESSETTVTSQAMSSNTVPTQTQFIDLTSSMRYWQQLSLLYRSRLQALASNISTTGSSIAGTATSTDTLKSSESTATVVGSETAVKSSSGELSFLKPESSQASSSSQDLTCDFSQDNSNPKLSHLIKPHKEINLEKDNSLRYTDSTDRPSVIVAASCKGNWDYASETQRNPAKLQYNQDIDDNRTKSSEPVLYRTSSENEVCSASFQHNRLRHFDNDDGDNDVSEKSMQAVLKRSFYGSPPKLSFIHDSAIACVNVGNSSGFGGSCGNYPGARKTAATQLDTAGRPAKRRKSKKSI